MTEAPFKRVFVDSEAARLPYAETFLSRLPAGLPVDMLNEGCKAPAGRANLYLTVRKGPFLKGCPCTPGAVECGYHVFSPMMGCPYTCSYCFLRFYAPDEPLTVYANLGDAEKEFSTWADTILKPVRLGTGEFADSLALDAWTGHAAWIAGLVAKYPNILTELKTKSGDPAPFLATPPLPNLIAAWSLNPHRLAASQEHLAAPVAARLAAAGKVAAADRPVAFHFDPVILTPDWREDYAELVSDLFAAVPAELIRWISLGTLRFPRRFLDHHALALRGNPLFFDEFVAGADGKLRYLWPERREVYRFLAERISEAGKGFPRAYLCMESDRMWTATFGKEPGERPVERLFW